MFSQILFKLKIYKGVLITRMISSLVITLRLQIATAHTHTHARARAHTHTHTHTHTHKMMSELTVKSNAIQEEKHPKTAYKISLKKIRNHPLVKCKWRLKYTTIKKSKINETCPV